MAGNDCNYNIDSLKLVREGTSQEQRPFVALDPAYAPVNERGPAYGMTFAQAYAAFLRFYNENNLPTGTWQAFFSKDVSVLLAVASIQDVDDYRQAIKSYFDFLNDLQHENDDADLRDHADYLFSTIATLSTRLDILKETLPSEIALKATLSNLIKSQLAPAFKRLIAYQKGGAAIADAEKPLNDLLLEKAAPLSILGDPALKFSTLGTAALSLDWTDGSNWPVYYGGIVADNAAYGSLAGTTVFERNNHLATYNLFTAVFDQFLKTYARVVNDAKIALEATFTNWDRHDPHYALFLAFLRLFEYARAEANTLTGRHLDYYYKEVLRLKAKPAEPSHAHLLVELTKQTPSFELEADTLFKAGKDDLGIDAFFANDRAFVANQAKVAALKNLYRHGSETVGTGANASKQNGRLYAAPVANSEDGLGAELLSADLSWHPFYHKEYEGGDLSQIKMPTAGVGFAVASHYLWMAEGTRWIWAEIFVGGYTGATFEDFHNDFVCTLTSEKGWIEKTPYLFFPFTATKFWLLIALDGQDPAITGYNAKTHGYTFQTDLPLLLVTLKQDAAATYIYPKFQDLTLSSINLQVFVYGLKSLAVSNDFGPVDTSKPFQPFGAIPVNGSAMLVGSKEIFQKRLTTATLNIEWQNPPDPFGTAAPAVNIDYLKAGTWLPSGIGAIGVGNASFPLTAGLDLSVVDLPDLTENEFYNTASTHGFVRFKLNQDFGQGAYQSQLLGFVRKDSGVTDPGNPPTGPLAALLSMHYSALQTIVLDSADIQQFNGRTARFFHLNPFGQAEQHPYLKTAVPDKAIYLLPTFKHLNTADDALPQGQPVTHEAEFYIGISGLKPPQNLALLFQVADGTADPLSAKPNPHLHWSFLQNNEWVAFKQEEVEDLTVGLTKSGVITFAMPRNASMEHTLLDTGLYWIRMAVASESDTVCRLLMVAAQALTATFEDKGNDPAFPTKTLEAGTISKLDQPQAAVKKLVQPFAAFGGRGVETADAFYTRISERLRHKDRAIALWDYERLVLEAFPQLYKAKCLNHTEYEPGIYRELAPGHVTFVTVPNQQFQNLRDPLKPYTSLGLLLEIEGFLKKRLSCFVKLHVKNPEFEEVRVDFKVRLYEGFDETFYVNKLKKEITQFLSPWAYGGSSPTFGGKIYKSVLINFVEERPYVDYVADFKLHHIYINESNLEVTSPDLNEVEGSKAISILVSVPEKEHLISILTEAEEEALREKCPCEA